MIKRPMPGEDEEDILRMQAEFLREKSMDQSHQPAAQVVNLRRTEPTKRASTDTGPRKQSKFAQSKGLKNQSEKNAKTKVNTSAVMGEILEKNIVEQPQTKVSDEENDKVYFPNVIPSLLGDIVEKNVDKFVDFNKPMPAEGFPVAKKQDQTVTTGKKTIHAANSKKKPQIQPLEMDIDEPTTSKAETSDNHKNLPSKSFLLSSKEADDIHSENINVLSNLTEQEILQEQQKLLANLDPKLVEFIKAKRTTDSTKSKANKSVSFDINTEKNMDTSEPIEPFVSDSDALWENDVLSHPHVEKWLHFDTLEKDKLEWMKGIEESKKLKDNEPYEARFNFKGYLLPYTMEYTEETKTLFHHGEEPHRPGYSLTELIELSRSSVTQQRVMALNTIAGVLQYYSIGTYKDVIEIPLSKIFFIIRFAMDENKISILEPALKAMRNLVVNRLDEACLDALLGFEAGTRQPCLENDKSEIVELDSKEADLKDFHLAEIDIIAALIRTEVLQRLYYILENIRPSFVCVQYALQILTRIARDSVITAAKIIDMDHLMHTIINNFLPTTSINFAFDPNMVYKGKPVLAAVKLLRILSLQSKRISDILISKYDILKPISEYICSGVDGTYGLRIQIEAFCTLSNLLHFDLGIENANSLFPIIVTTLYKHVKGTDVLIDSSVISATHAAVVLQFINTFLNCRMIYLEGHKHQIYPLIKEGVPKWLAQLSRSESFTCGHLRLICAALDCCKTMVHAEQLQMKFLNDSLKTLATSRGFKELINHLEPCSNLLSGLESKNLHLIKNLIGLGSSVIDSTQNILPILNVASPFPFLASLFNLLIIVNDKTMTFIYLTHITNYQKKLVSTSPSLCDNWFTRIEMNFVFSIVQLSNQVDVIEGKKDLLYAVASKLCYILRSDTKYDLLYIFNNIIFNKRWFTAERLMNIVSLSDDEGFTRALTFLECIRQSYRRVLRLNYIETGPNIMLRKWQEPVLPRDWIYLPILGLYSQSQECEKAPKVAGEHAAKVAFMKAAEKEKTIICSLEWILFNELCFPDLLSDIDVTDRFCRIMSVFLCDQSLFLDARIKLLLHKCTRVLFKKKTAFNFDKELTGLNNFQDFYTQFLEQFQSVSYGDSTFAACVLVPLAQRHNVKWRKLLWSEYAGCLRALDCPEHLMCYEMQEYLHPDEIDESLIKSYFQALSGNLLRPDTVAFKIATHHVEAFKERSKLK